MVTDYISSSQKMCEEGLHSLPWLLISASDLTTL